MSTLCSACLFCRILRKEIPSIVVYETPKILAFMDIYPISKGHVLIIPNHHVSKMHELPDSFLEEILLVSKKIIKASIKAIGISDYNILQNNGKLAHQEIEHVHFHLIPKYNQEEGLGIKWPAMQADVGELKTQAASIQSALDPGDLQTKNDK